MEGHCLAIWSGDPQLLHLFRDSDDIAFTFADLLVPEMEVCEVSKFSQNSNNSFPVKSYDLNVLKSSCCAA